MALVLASDSVIDITKGTCFNMLLPSLRSQKLSKATLEVEFPHFRLNIVNIMEPGLAIDVPDPTYCLQQASKVNAVYYADPWSRKYDLDPHLVTSQLAVVELPGFSGQNVWVFIKRRDTESTARERGMLRALPDKAKEVTTTRKSLRSLREVPSRSAHSKGDTVDVWEP
ncbi:hypothetical protein BGZ63DRAFT_396822 [Mariannaea sp. PMI_226]|nr:hypothetical protein BGZ63DRAFT_396822 [Mariannaea sp. PMI_226]